MLGFRFPDDRKIVGHIAVSGGGFVAMTKRPNFIQRFAMRVLFGWAWYDIKR
jgi:hypothetical protein